MKAHILQLTSLFTWWWLPSFGSRLLLNACYSLHLVSPPPANAHRLRNNHLHLARSLVIIFTLVYQLYTTITTAEPNYYQLLSLRIDVDSDSVKRSFRALARKYHPDKSGSQNEPLFILLRTAHDSLSNPAKRFAYDRFGTTIASCQNCTTHRDFILHGLPTLVGFYTINPVLHSAFAWLSASASPYLSFWKLACLFSLFALEVSTILSPHHPVWLRLLFPRSTIHDATQIAHSLFVNCLLASIQLCVALHLIESPQHPQQTHSRSKHSTHQPQWHHVRRRLQQLDHSVEMVTVGVERLFAREMRPFRMAKRADREGEGGREMGFVEQTILERIDAVVLGRSLVQQHPPLILVASKLKEKHKQEQQIRQIKKEIVDNLEMQLNPTSVKAKPESASPQPNTHNTTPPLHAENVVHIKHDSDMDDMTHEMRISSHVVRTNDCKRYKEGVDETVDALEHGGESCE